MMRPFRLAGIVPVIPQGQHRRGRLFRGIRKALMQDRDQEQERAMGLDKTSDRSDVIS
jgi:hypothetical protein